MTAKRTTPAAAGASSFMPEQRARLVEAMRQYLSAPAGRDGKTPVEHHAELDRNRAKLIENDLKPLLVDYLGGRVLLDVFKTRVDGLNKRNEYWGFKGIKGQMFFNMVVNQADLDECDAELKTALKVPEDDEVARARIKKFADCVKRIGDRHVERGGSKQGRPKISSVPFFLSYFWQVQRAELWPVYYTNTVNQLGDLNIWSPTGDVAEDYLAFRAIHDSLMRLFTSVSGKPFGQYQVEHVFWFKGGKPYGGPKPEGPEGRDGTVVVPPRGGTPQSLPESYVPPVVAILPQMAALDPQVGEAARASGTTIERAFEKHVNAVFTILGYEARLLGQGQGRVPDGEAVDPQNLYAIIWDAKARADSYSMGTDDRAIREYIMTRSRELKRQRSLRNLYYVIISSRFPDGSDAAIRSLKMDTGISEVCLVEAGALVAMVDSKLRDPQGISLGPDGIQQLFSASGIVCADMVRTTLG